MSDFGRRGAANSRSAYNPNGVRFATQSNFWSTKTGGFIVLVALFIVGFLGAAILTRLLAPASVSKPRSGPALDDGKIQRGLQVCVPVEPPGDEDWQLLREADRVRGAGWTVKEGDPKTWIPAGLIPQYLKCAAETERKRFCNSSYRAQYASQLTRYYVTLAMWGAMSEMAAVALKRQAEAQGALGSSGDIATGRVNMAAQHPFILNAVRDLSRDGLLSARDFGWLGPPQHLKPILEKEPRTTGTFCD